MSVPTSAEIYSQLTEHLRKAQEASAMMAHLCRDEDKLRAQGWLAVSEMFKKTLTIVIKLATKGRFN